MTWFQEKAFIGPLASIVKVDSTYIPRLTNSGDVFLKSMSMLIKFSSAYFNLNI